MFLRNGYPYDTKEIAIAEIKTSAFLANPGNKAEGLTDGEPILARYFAYFRRKTEGGVTTFTEEFPTSSTDISPFFIFFAISIPVIFNSMPSASSELTVTPDSYTPGHPIILSAGHGSGFHQFLTPFTIRHNIIP
jgi:hypothetical protein